MPENRLLASLPRDLQDSIASTLDTISFEIREPLGKRGEPIQWVYFPTTCMISVVVDFDTGNTIEAELIGNDGYTGTNALLGQDVTNINTMIQVPGEASRMAIADFRRHLADERFRSALGDYSSNAFTIVGQMAGCVAFHPLEQRLARWLLMVRDRVDREDLPLTQEFLGIMLGVYRPTVTIAMSLLMRAGLIEHRRGYITIVDRPGLEQAACECYAVIRALSGHRLD